MRTEVVEAATALDRVAVRACTPPIAIEVAAATAVVDIDDLTVTA